MSKRKLIYTSYSPNTRNEDLKLNFKLFFQPFKWKLGDSELSIVEYFKKYYPKSRAFVYNYARSAMYHFFMNQEVKTGDEIIYQGYTCSAAILPAVWAGLTPVYCDIDEKTLCLDHNKLKKQITENTKYIVVQHTLGLSPEMEKIRRLADEKGIMIIEDCTHYLPHGDSAKFGEFGDVSIFSFGRDKVVSGVDGGVLLVNNESLVETISSSYLGLPYPDGKWTLQRVLFPIIWWYVKKFYFSKVGKLIHLFAMKTGILTKATSPEEKRGDRPKYIPARLPNALSVLAYNQLKDIDDIQTHRNKVSDIYEKLTESVEVISFSGFSHSPLRYPILVENRDDLIKYCYDQGINLGNWYSQPISPMGVDPLSLGYVAGSCPVAESMCKKIINLPTHVNISEEDCSRIVDTIANAQNLSRE